MLCNGLNAFPVCDCILYVPCLRCSFLFLCEIVCVFMCLWYGLYLLFAYRFHWFVLCVLLCYVLVVFDLRVYGLFVMCCVAVCCFNGLSCVYVSLLLLFCVRCCVFCYSLNPFPACDGMLYVPCLRCAVRFV